MNSAFSELILADKLSKLNTTQQCIETLSHWCIFHRSQAEQVIETWNKQFNNSEMAQRVPLLYLANDIHQSPSTQVSLSLCLCLFSTSLDSSNNEQNMPTLSNFYTMQDAFQHNTKDDCWIVVNGKVPTFLPLFLSNFPSGSFNSFLLYVLLFFQGFCIKYIKKTVFVLCSL